MCDWRPFCAFSLIKHSIGRNTACHLLKKTENRIFLRIINALAVCLCLIANMLRVVAAK